MSRSTADKRREVIARFYGGERKVYMHNFDETTGICNKCHVFIAEATMRICPVIGPEEVARFRDYDNR